MMSDGNEPHHSYRRWLLEPILERLDSLEAHLAQIDDEIATLQADVTAEGTTIDSAVTLISGISAQISAAVAAATAAGATPAQLQAMTDLDTAVKAKTQALASAVTAAAPTP
jgi:hypothetical protein